MAAGGEAMFASNDVANGAATKLGMFSTFVTTSLRRLNLGCGLALDMPCGHGRHSLLLAMYGIDVLSADLDSAALTDTIQAAKRQPCSSILALQLDAHRPLPFRESVFDLVVVVHFSVIDIVGIVTPLLKVGGHLILETFGAQGENWKGLPKRNHVAMQLAPQFNLVVYQEAPVRRSPEHVTLKAVARRRRY